MDVKEVYDEVVAFRTENKQDHAAIYKTVNSHAERITKVETEAHQLGEIQKACQKEKSAKALQVRGKALDVMVKLAILLIVAGASATIAAVVSAAIKNGGR